MCRINPKVDFAFKKLFGSTENKDILKDLINAIVFEEDRIDSLELRNPYNFKEFLTDKESILDIKATSCTGKIYNIEMQVLKQDYYAERSLYYWSKNYSMQLTQGINYNFLKKTICINIMNYNCLPEKEYHNVYRIKNLVTEAELSSHLEIHFIELKKYDERMSTLLDRWTNFLAKAETYDSDKFPAQLLEVPTIKKALEIMQTMSLDDKEREYYEKRLGWLRDEEMALLTAKKEGLQEGIEKGLQAGIEKGLQEGLGKGRIEGKIEVVKNLLMKNFQVTDIAELTGLDVDEIERVKQDL